jgi:hypothetical protein
MIRVPQAVEGLERKSLFAAYMIKPLPVLVLGLLLQQFAVAAPSAPSIAPPFGLSWIETRKEINQLIDEAHLRLIQKNTVDHRESWTVQGFDQPYLSTVVFYFVKDNLDEVELQYQDPSWTLGQYGELMSQIKEDLDRKYGRGEMLTRSRELAKDVSQTVLGYRWQGREQALDLMFYAAEREPLFFRLLSMHYKQAHR